VRLRPFAGDVDTFQDYDSFVPWATVGLATVVTPEQLPQMRQVLNDSIGRALHEACTSSRSSLASSTRCPSTATMVSPGRSTPAASRTTATTVHTSRPGPRAAGSRPAPRSCSTSRARAQREDREHAGGDQHGRGDEE
jgi:hypothetical protein